MTFDPKGTAPGVQPSPNAPKIVHMKCKNPNCKSIRAIEASFGDNNPTAGAPHHRQYRCVECHEPNEVAVGGSVNF